MPLGLSQQTRTYLATLETRRRSLYALFVTFMVFVLLFFLVVARVYSLEAVEARLPGWLSSVMGLLLPGLPTALLDFTERHPLAVLVMGVSAYCLRRASRKAKEAAQDCAFQAWLRTSTVGRQQVYGPAPAMRHFRWVPPPVVTFSLAGIVIVVFWVNTISPQQQIHRPKDVAQGSCSDGVRGDCWLISGEAVLVRINAERARNETGVLLEKDSCYSTRLVAQAGWRDGPSIEPPAEGFEFDSDVFGFTKFWWMRWLRPRPGGRWFEIVGRVARQADVFPVLHATDARRIHRFVAPDDGELVLHVNDVPFANNRGVVTMELRKCSGGIQ